MQDQQVCAERSRLHGGAEPWDRAELSTQARKFRRLQERRFRPVKVRQNSHRHQRLRIDESILLGTLAIACLNDVETRRSGPGNLGHEPKPSWMKVMGRLLDWAVRPLKRRKKKTARPCAPRDSGVGWLARLCEPERVSPTPFRGDLSSSISLWARTGGRSWNMEESVGHVWKLLEAGEMAGSLTGFGPSRAA